MNGPSNELSFQNNNKNNNHKNYEAPISNAHCSPAVIWLKDIGKWKS